MRRCYFMTAIELGGDNPPVQGVEVKLLYSQRGWSMMDLRFRVFGFRVQGLGLEFRV